MAGRNALVSLLMLLMMLVSNRFCLSFRPELIRRSKLAATTTTTTLFGNPPRRPRSSIATPDALEWETFEFGDSPKWERRFDNRGMIASTAGKKNADLSELAAAEADLDAAARNEMAEQIDAWERLDPVVVDRATELLTPFLTPERMERMQSVLHQRTRHTRLLFENPANPSNIWACLRTIDSFGIQHVDVVTQAGQYKGKAAISQKRGMRTAMGSARWLTLRNHASTADAVRYLKEQHGCRIIASDLNPTSRDIREISWSKDYGNDAPICIVMGNEDRGISDEMRELADDTFTLPMYGFAESFNLSVATAITLAHLSAVEDGPLKRGDLPEQQLRCLLLKGILNSFPKRRTAEAILKQNNIVLPDDMRLL